MIGMLIQPDIIEKIEDKGRFSEFAPCDNYGLWVGKVL